MISTYLKIQSVVRKSDIEMGYSPNLEVIAHKKTRLSAESTNWEKFRKELESNLCPIPRTKETKGIKLAIQALEDDHNKTLGQIIMEICHKQ